MTVGTFLAVFVALLIALRDGYERKREARERGRALSALLFMDAANAGAAVRAIKDAVDVFRGLHAGSDTFTWRTEEARVQAAITTLGATRLTELSDQFFQLPRNHAANLSLAVGAFATLVAGSELFLKTTRVSREKALEYGETLTSLSGNLLAWLQPFVDEVNRDLKPY